MFELSLPSDPRKPPRWAPFCRVQFCARPARRTRGNAPRDWNALAETQQHTAHHRRSRHFGAHTRDRLARQPWPSCRCRRLCFRDSFRAQKKRNKSPLAHTRLVHSLAAVGLVLARSLCLVKWRARFARSPKNSAHFKSQELELEQIQIHGHMAQKPILRAEVHARCARVIANQKSLGFTAHFLSGAAKAP